MSIRKISISEFVAHADEEVDSVAKGSSVVELTREGRVVAVVYPAPQPIGNAGTLADYAGTGAGFTLAEGCALEDPAFSPEEWDDAPGDNATDR